MLAEKRDTQDKNMVKHTDVTSNVAVHSCNVADVDNSTFLITLTLFVILVAKLMSCRVLGYVLVMCNYSDMYFNVQRSLDCDCHSKN